MSGILHRPFSAVKLMTFDAGAKQRLFGVQLDFFVLPLLKEYRSSLRAVLPTSHSVHRSVPDLFCELDGICCKPIIDGCNNMNL